MFGMISYLPDGEDRKRRWSVVKESLENYYAMARGKEFVLVITNWNEEKEWLNERGIGYVEIPIDSRGAAASRNIILDKFYESQADYLWLSDDDVYWDWNNPKVEGLIKILNTTPERLIKKQLYIFNGYKHCYRSKKDDLLFEAVASLSGGLMVIANPCKYFGKKIFQREDFQKQGYGGEDVMFEFEYTSAHNCRSFICKDLYYRLLTTPSVFWDANSVGEQRRNTENHISTFVFMRDGCMIDYNAWLRMPTYDQQKRINLANCK